MDFNNSQKILNQKIDFNIISLFSSGGIGDLGFRSSNYKLSIANELLPERAELFKHNFPNTKMFVGDIWKKSEEIIQYSIENNINPFLIFATPPCQGMSSNGVGKLLSEYRNAKRPKLDPRNRLILPALKIITKLSPEWIVLENVCGMQNTVIEDNDGKLKNILSIIKNNLGDEYIGYPKELEFADYGLPQKRKRLITIYTKNKEAKRYYSLNIDLFPNPSHSESGGKNLSKWVSLKEAIGNFPLLDSINKEKARDRSNPLHHVAVLDEIKYEWIKNTPEGKSAFDNQCINPNCRYLGNPIHGMKKENGINQSKKDTPLFCIKCGSLLPRPYVEEKGIKRIMKGYTSAYKRMNWSEPASTLTTNFSYPCSDRKLHPSQNRTLSIAEACVLQSISSYDYSWGPVVINKKHYKIATDSLIRDLIGESVTPMIIEKIANHIKKLSTPDLDVFKFIPENKNLKTYFYK